MQFKQSSNFACACVSGLPQGKALLGSSPSAIAMFYPQISAYEIHPLIINQRRRSAFDKSDADLNGSSDDSGPLGLVTNQSYGSTTPLPLSLRHLYRVSMLIVLANFQDKYTLKL